MSALSTWQQRPIPLTTSDNCHEEKHPSQVTKERNDPIDKQVSNTTPAVQECSRHILQEVSSRHVGLEEGGLP